jgi:hypothetical protein
LFEKQPIENPPLTGEEFPGAPGAVDSAGHGTTAFNPSS